MGAFSHTQPGLSLASTGNTRIAQFYTRVGRRGQKTNDARICHLMTVLEGAGTSPRGHGDWHLGSAVEE